MATTDGTIVWPKTCEWCGAMFDGKRNSRYCCDICKAERKLHNISLSQKLQRGKWESTDQTCGVCGKMHRYQRKVKRCAECRQSKRHLPRICEKCGTVFEGYRATVCAVCRTIHEKEQRLKRARDRRTRAAECAKATSQQYDGAICEALFDVWCLQRGWIPFAPLMDGCPHIDRCVVKDTGECLRVQVRKATITTIDSVRVLIARDGRMISVNHVDMLCAIEPIGMDVWMIPIVDLPKQRQMRLHYTDRWVV